MIQNTGTTRLLRISSVLARVPVSRSYWYKLIKAGKAPSPLALSVKSSVWLESDIDDFIAKLVKGGEK